MAKYSFKFKKTVMAYLNGAVFIQKKRTQINGSSLDKAIFN